MKKEFPQKWAYQLKRSERDQFRSILEKIGIASHWSIDSIGSYYMIDNNRDSRCSDHRDEKYTKVSLQELLDHYLPELVSPGYTIEEIKAGKFACKVSSFDEIVKIRQYLGNDERAWNYFKNSRHWPKYINITDGSTHSDTSTTYYNNNGYTILTINDIKFPNEMQKKKIIGYKAPMDLFEGKIKKGNLFYANVASGYIGTDGTEIGKASTISGTYLPKEIVETWEPVYQELYEVGDFVFAVNCGGNGILGEGEQLVEIVDNSFSGKASGLVDDWDFVVRQEKSFFNVNSTTAKFRKATPKEIQKWNDDLLPTIKGYKAEISGESVSFGCVVLSKTGLQTIRYLLTSAAVATITIHGTNITTEMIDKLLKAIN